LSQEVSTKDEKIMSRETAESPPLTDNAKSSLKIVFLTLLLDLVGFSIIFPLFPALAKYYLVHDGDDFFLRLIFDSIHTILNVSGQGEFKSIVLFGGALGGIYSFLQFLAAPLWGRLSDKIGRRPVLIISIAGMVLSYVLWIFSGSFTLIVLSRFIGGIMGGNISTATAIVADVTQKENRSKGMAFIGIAFAVGFIIGPSLGGIFSMIDLTKYLPQMVGMGINPFSAAAAVACLLSVVNLFWVILKFEESLPENKRGKGENFRSVNPFKLFKPLPYAGINTTIIAHFIFLLSFSGMEFTLTFLAVERLNYTSMNNAVMFIFIGFVLALVQGGFVRRKAHSIGEKKMVIMGLIAIIPGLLLISAAHSSFVLFAGLFFLSCGVSMVIPCLTSLVSLYTPSEVQGQSIGVFRSLGALARVFGPIFAAVIYWRLGTSSPYLIGSIILMVPILMVSQLPNPEDS
jgi:MFS family permease